MKRMTESRLRRIIREVIEEMPSRIPVQDSNYPQGEDDDYSAEEAVEEPSIEEKHFGFSLDTIGKKITKALELWDRSPEFHHLQLSEFVEMTAKDPKFKLLGEGSFRMVFSYGNDYVIKVATPRGEDFIIPPHALEMNKEDAMFGRMPKYSSLFPKVYQTDAAYKWIIMEKCVAINNEEIFLKFFPNPAVDPFVADNLLKLQQFSYVLLYCVCKADGHQELMKIETITSYLERRANSLSISFEELIRSYEKLTLFNKIVDFCAEFGVLPREIRLGNVGISSDGRFVIIDSSVGETINNAIFK